MLIKGFEILWFYFNIIFNNLKSRWPRRSSRITWRATWWRWIWRIYLNNGWTYSRTVWWWFGGMTHTIDRIWTWGDALCWVRSILRFDNRIYKLLRATQQMMKVWIWFQFTKCLTPIERFDFMIYFTQERHPAGYLKKFIKIEFQGEMGMMVRFQSRWNSGEVIFRCC